MNFLLKYNIHTRKAINENDRKCVCKDMEQLEILCADDGSVNEHGHFGGKYLAIPSTSEPTCYMSQEL